MKPWPSFVPKPKRQPTTRTIQRMVTRLQAALAAVYGDDGHHEAQRTNEHGTLTVTWRSGEYIRKKALRGEGDERGPV